MKYLLVLKNVEKYWKIWKVVSEMFIFAYLITENMKRLSSFIVFVLFFMSCEETDISKEYSDNPVLELKNVTSMDIDATNGRVIDSSISELKEITLNLDGQEMTGQIAFLDDNFDTQRIAIMGNDGVAYSYIDITERNGIPYAKYYTYSGELYLETNLKNKVINIIEAYNISRSTNGRIHSWFNRFDNCVDRFVETVQNDAAWGAVMVVGAMCCAAEVLAGLAIGCSISASR